MYISTFVPRNFPRYVIATSKTYASSLSKILSATDADVVQAYLVTRAGLSLAPYLGMGTEVWQAQRTLDETLQGIKKGQVPDRSDWCVNHVENTLGFAVGRFFVQETFGGDSKEKGTKVITGMLYEIPTRFLNLSHACIYFRHHRDLQGVPEESPMDGRRISDGGSTKGVLLSYHILAETCPPDALY